MASIKRQTARCCVACKVDGSVSANTAISVSCINIGSGVSGILACGIAPISVTANVPTAPTGAQEFGGKASSHNLAEVGHKRKISNNGGTPQQQRQQCKQWQHSQRQLPLSISEPRPPVALQDRAGPSPLGNNRRWAAPQATRIVPIEPKRRCRCHQDAKHLAPVGVPR